MIPDRVRAIVMDEVARGGLSTREMALFIRGNGLDGFADSPGQAVMFDAFARLLDVPAAAADAELILRGLVRNVFALMAGEVGGTA